MGETPQDIGDESQIQNPLLTLEVTLCFRFGSNELWDVYMQLNRVARRMFCW